jgi:hypothetical protein
MRILLLLLMTMLVLPAQGRLYRWVDENGNVHYSDRLPPQAVKNPHATLDERGLVLEKEGRAKTPEEIAKEEELKRLREEQKRQLEEQKARDKVLLNTFRSEDDIILARDGKLATYDAQIRIAYTNIERLKAWLETQKKKAAALERKGRKVPQKLLREIENTRNQIKANYESILRQEKDKDLLRRKYAADLKRFRELKALKSANREEEDARHAGKRDNIVETVIVCDQSVDCDSAWDKARAYARQHATTRIYVDTRRMFMTQPPRKKDDISITVSRLRPLQDRPEIIFLDVSCKKTVANATWCETDQAKKIRLGFRAAVLGGQAADPATQASTSN